MPVRVQLRCPLGREPSRPCRSDALLDLVNAPAGPASAPATPEGMRAGRRGQDAGPRVGQASENGQEFRPLRAFLAKATYGEQNVAIANNPVGNFAVPLESSSDINVVTRVTDVTVETLRVFPIEIRGLRDA